MTHSLTSMIINMEICISKRVTQFANIFNKNIGQNCRIKSDFRLKCIEILAFVVYYTAMNMENRHSFIRHAIQMHSLSYSVLQSYE